MDQEKMKIPAINKQVTAAAKANRDQNMPLPFQDAYGAAWFTIDETNSIIGKLNKPVFELDSEEAEVVFLMLFNSLSDVICAVYTLNSGWIRPSVTALRGALETIATALTVRQNPEKMVRFLSGKLEVPKEVITPAKQFLPDIGRLTGALTGQWTHETYDSTARSIHEASGKLLLVPNINSDWLPVYLNTFVQAALLAQMVGIRNRTLAILMRCEENSPFPCGLLPACRLPSIVVSAQMGRSLQISVSQPQRPTSKPW